MGGLSPDDQRNRRRDNRRRLVPLVADTVYRAGRLALAPRTPEPSVATHRDGRGTYAEGAATIRRLGRYPAEVCLRCGERLYAVDVVKRFEQIRASLERQGVDDFQPLGRSFQVV